MEYGHKSVLFFLKGRCIHLPVLYRLAGICYYHHLHWLTNQCHFVVVAQLQSFFQFCGVVVVVVVEVRRVFSSSFKGYLRLI